MLTGVSTLADLREKRFILIAGVSGSGKSYYAKQLGAKLGYSVFHTDWVLNGLDKCETQSGGILNHETNKNIMRVLCPKMMEARIESIQDQIVFESSWIDTSHWKSLIERLGCQGIYAIFFGYPNAIASDIQDRVKVTNHWINCAENRLQVIKAQIDNSAALREQRGNLEASHFMDVSGGFASQLAEHVS